MIRQVSKWESSDGSLFDTEDEAEKYEVKIEFENWYNDDRMIIDEELFSIDFRSVHKWLELYWEDIVKFMSVKPF